MDKQCDHKSVGMLVWDNDNLLLIERKRPPFGFAPPAGHVDNDSSFEQAAVRELKEEVDLDTKAIKLIAQGRKENHCRRIDGNWHFWKIYAVTIKGKESAAKSEVRQIKWCTHPNLLELAERTEQYLKGKITEGDWKKSPGLEPVWYSWFKELKII